MVREVADPAANHRQTLGSEQRHLQLRKRPVAPDTSASGDDPVVGKSGEPDRPHQVADGSCGSRPARHCGHVAVSRDSTRGDTSECADHALLKGCGFRHCGHIAQRAMIVVSERPCARGRVAPTRAIRVGARSAGVDAVSYRPLLMPAP